MSPIQLRAAVATGTTVKLVLFVCAGESVAHPPGGFAYLTRKHSNRGDQLEGSYCKLKRCPKCQGLHGRKDAYCTMCRQAYMRLWSYGISYEEYRALLEQQDNACAVCRVAFTREPCVDHDHKTGKVRGLLCTGCNTGIGKLGDSIQGLLRAATYLTGRMA